MLLAGPAFAADQPIQMDDSPGLQGKGFTLYAGYQFGGSQSNRGPWNAEKLWHPQHAGQPTWIVPVGRGGGSFFGSFSFASGLAPTST